MNWPLVAIHQILLKTGKVLLMDGWQTPNQTQLFDPATQAMTPVPNGLGLDLFCVGNVTLADGRVVMVGGDSSATHSIDATTIFDPSTGQWTAGPRLNIPRWYPTATELGDGRLVTISGQISTNTWADTPEIYDPASNTWTLLSKINTSQVHEQEYPLSYLLPSGNIVTIGVETGQSYALDPVAQTWTAVGGSTLMNGTAAEYRPGQILYSGGGTPLNSANPAQASAQVIDFNSATPTWQATGSMNSPRYTHTLTVLPDGKVLAVGGSTVMDDIYPSKAVLSSEEWDPATGAWTTLASMQVPRMYHSTAVLLPDGRVLVAGSGHDENITSPGQYNAQFYSPPYLFQGARPAITSAPASATYGSAMTVQTPDAASIASAALVSLGADTHTLDMNQHFVPLNFTSGSGALNVQVPTSPSVAPPGYYMLFILNSAGVPSVASIVQITPNNQPPTVNITAPNPGATVSGTSVALSAAASDPAGVSAVQFLVDGSPVGPRLTAPPYTTSWDTTTVPNGVHTITAQATSTAGVVGSATPVSVTVSNPGATGPTVDSKVSAEGHGAVTTPAFSTGQPGDVLVAFASSDGPNSTPQTLSISGAGLTWSLVKRANAQPGTTEIWTAKAPSQLSNVTITSTQQHASYDQSLTVIVFSGAQGIGATAAASAASGAPSVSLTTTAPTSWVFGSGNDYDNSIARTLGSGHTLVYQWVDTVAGDTYWVQSRSAPTPASGTTVTINDTAPTTDRWNLAAVEVLAS
jgi:hypothetical protein